MKSDRDIVQSVLQGNIDDYSFLIDRYENSLYGFIMQIVRNKHLAEEVTQETFVRAFEKIHTLRNQAAFGAWIFKTARREAIRSSRAIHKTEQLLPAHFSDSEDSQDLSIEEQQMLFDSLNKLPRHEQKTIYLKHFGGYTAQEIAGMNGCPAGTITKQLSRAYARLRGWLKEIER